MPLVVIKDGMSYTVIDGQHHLQALRRLVAEKALCVVVPYDYKKYVIFYSREKP